MDTYAECALHVDGIRFPRLTTEHAGASGLLGLLAVRCLAPMNIVLPFEVVAAVRNRLLVVKTLLVPRERHRGSHQVTRTFSNQNPFLAGFDCPLHMTGAPTK